MSFALTGSEEENIDALRRNLVGFTCVQAGCLETGELVLEFEKHILVFSGKFFIASNDEISKRPLTI